MMLLNGRLRRYVAKHEAKSRRTGQKVAWGEHPFWRLRSCERWMWECDRASSATGITSGGVYDRWRRRKVVWSRSASFTLRREEH